MINMYTRKELGGYYTVKTEVLDLIRTLARLGIRSARRTPISWAFDDSIDWDNL